MMKAKLYHKQYHARKIQMKKAQAAPNERKMKGLHKEQYLCICWTGRDSPELQYFPVWLNKNKMRKWENGKFFCTKFVPRKKQILKVIWTGKRKNDGIGWLLMSALLEMVLLKNYPNMRDSLGQWTYDSKRPMQYSPNWKPPFACR